MVSSQRRNAPWYATGEEREDMLVDSDPAVCMAQLFMADLYLNVEIQPRNCVEGAVDSCFGHSIDTRADSLGFGPICAYQMGNSCDLFPLLLPKHPTTTSFFHREAKIQLFLSAVKTKKIALLLSQIPVVPLSWKESSGTLL